MGRPAHQHTCLSLQALCPRCHLAALPESPYTQEHSTPPRWPFPQPCAGQDPPLRIRPPPPPTPTRSVLLTHLTHRRENAGKGEVYVRSVGARISQHPWAEPRGSPTRLHAPKVLHTTAGGPQKRGVRGPWSRYGSVSAAGSGRRA